MRNIPEIIPEELLISSWPVFVLLGFFLARTSV